MDFGFLDFSTLERRRHDCEEELRLNRRFSPELYLAVVAITEDPQGPVIAGTGTTIDYAVKMRRFDESQLLDNIAARGELDEHLVRSIARELARLHAQLPRCFPDPEGTDAGTPAALKAALEQNFEQLHRYPLRCGSGNNCSPFNDGRWGATTSCIQPCTAGARRLGDRRPRGRPSWEYGDYRRAPCACSTASNSTRSFALSTVLRRSRCWTWISMRENTPPNPTACFLTTWNTGTTSRGLALLDLYGCYYALVRAKVNLLQLPPDCPDLENTDAYRELQRYLGFAYRYCQPRRQFLAITHGLSGSGKSTVAARLVEASGAVRLRSDVERKRLFGLAPEQRSLPQDAATLYSTDMSQKTFRHLGELAEAVLEAGFPVIVDGTFLHRDIRDDFRHLARRLNVPFAILACVADIDDIETRLVAREQGRGDASEAGIAVMEQQRCEIEPAAGEELDFLVEVDSGWDASELWNALPPAACIEKPGRSPAPC